jgi:hypothetical protein
VFVSHVGVVILGLHFACVEETLVGVVGLTGLGRGTKFGCPGVDDGTSNYRGVGPLLKIKLLIFGQLWIPSF